MKIKTVCDITGLTDRTIRFYIEEQLIFPTYIENYLGRKSFDFSQDDIDALNNIAVLRKFDFTVEEIREIIKDSRKSKSIIQNVKNRSKQALAAEQTRQSVLSQINDDRIYTMAELARELSTASACLPYAEENNRKLLLRSIFTNIKTVFAFLIVWMPFVMQVFFFCCAFLVYTYPKFSQGIKIYMLLSVLPSVLVIILSKLKGNWKKIPRAVLLVLCVFSLLLSFVVGKLPAGVIAKSETTNIHNYLELDPECLANGSIFFHELFPGWPHYFVNEHQPDGSYETVYLDARYYYRYITTFDYTYDIYAEWPLEMEAFDKEVERVTELFNKRASAEDKQFLTIQKGNYTCLVYSVGYTSDPPFEAVTDSYTYFIFAYDKENLRVRYIYCDSLENGADQPYYLSLAW